MLGEIYISGAGLARGYHNNPGQTAERFINNPFLPGRKMYKTGDVARWLPEGILEYVGRNDTQVKFHGHRLDLNEIRSTLNLHPGISDNVVVIVKDDNGNDVLVAYYVSSHELETAELRSTLAGKIVAATIPNIFAHLKELPLTSNGKVDGRKLPPLEEIRQQSKPDFIAPRTPNEHFVADTWEQLLGISHLGVHDNFFELGGHSLLAYQVTTRLCEAFQFEIPMRAIFDAPTVAGLALTLTKMQVERGNIDDMREMVEEIKQMTPDEVASVLAGNASLTLS